MSAGHRDPAARSGSTNAYQGGPPYQNPTDRACDFPYQTLPDPVLAERTPLVHLDWSTNAYHSLNLSLNRPGLCFTNYYHHGEGLWIKPNQPFRVGQYRRGGCHMGSRVKGYNCIEQWHTRENRTA